MLPEKHWVLPEDVDLPEEFKNFIGGDPLVAQTLYRRGIRKIQEARAFLDPEFFKPCKPHALPDSQAAWDLLQEALVEDQLILVWGDFDVDGQTATALLVECLRELGGRVNYHIPVRGEESHGITKEVLDAFLEKGFDLLLTCDTGISEQENVLRVRQAGKPVIVTDHHALSESLPPANAVVNPQRLQPGHPLRTLPGVGVAYKLMEGLFDRMEKRFSNGHYLELAALGIVADVAELYQDTRYLLQKGLSSLRQTQRVGLQTLYRNAKLNPLQVNESHIGFQIGPRLNAVGRLTDANPMVDFLTTRDQGQARVLGTQIEALNAKRRFATRQVDKAAEAKLAASPDDRHAAAIVLHHPEWPGGVVGIVASRLVERYNKPVILLTGEDPIHGSARSVPGVNVTEAIASQSRLLSGFGGHPMAAGLSLPADNLSAFKFGFLAEVRERIEQIEVVPEVQIDREITLDQISFDLIEQIERLAPFGPGNPTLNFLLRDLKVESSTALGAQGEHRQVTVTDRAENSQRFIWWNGGDEPLPEAQFDLVCTLSQSDYKSQRQISAEWVDYRLSEQGRQEVARAPIEIIDKRSSLTPEKELHRLLAEQSNLQVWAEGPLPKGFPGKGRHELTPCAGLIIWSCPPSSKVLETVLRKTNPNQVILFGVEPALKTPKALMERLGGLAKHTVNQKGGLTMISQLASACAIDADLVRVGLKLWEVMGNLNFEIDGDQVRIEQTSEKSNQGSVEIYQEILLNLMNEMNAYRQYFNRATPETLFSSKLQ
ncbi:MAG: single-stranded-DNA-specific exonuclease RecJ [Brevefilum sp.]